MKKIIALLLGAMLLMACFTLSAAAASTENEGERCSLLEDMTELVYEGKTYKYLNENIAVVNGEKASVGVNAEKTVTDQFDKIEATLYLDADYIISVTFEWGFTETVEYYVREDKYTDVISIPNEFTASIYNIGYSNLSLTYQEKIAWRSDSKLHTVSPDLVSFDESYSMLSSDNDGIIWFNAGEVCRTLQNDGSWKYYMIDYAEYDADCFDTDGMLDFSYLSETGRSLTLIELTDTDMAARITEAIRQMDEEDYENSLFGEDDYYDDYEGGLLFGTMSDLAIAIICGIFFALIPLVVAAVCLGSLYKKPAAAYNKMLRLIIAAAGVVILCYVAVLLILVL